MRAATTTAGSVWQLSVPSSASPQVAVLFDLDGVIVDSRNYHMAAWEQWALVEGVAHPPGYFHDMFGRRNDAIIGGLLQNVAPAEFQRLARRKESLFRDAARGNIEPLPGVLPLLATLANLGVPQAIVTSTPRENLDLILDSWGIADRFGALVAEEDASKGKPDKEGFLVAAAALDAEPRACIVIEDAPAGIEAAKAAGMRAIGVTTTHEARLLRTADLVASSMSDAAILAFITSLRDGDIL
jgi:HAD superfamily hydrolase (TIGR01509 family)